MLNSQVFLNLDIKQEKIFLTWLKSPFYWIITMLMILAGGFMVIIYTKAGIILNPLVAVNIGASAPLILGTIIAQAPVLGKVN